MLRLYTSVFLCFIIQTIAAQQPEFQWAKAFLANNQSNPSVGSNGRSVAVDQAGNVYSAGLFTYATDFDPGPGSFTLSAANWSNTAIYLSKLSPTGDFLWAIQIPTHVEFGNIEIKVDKNNHVYIASELRIATDFDPGPAVYSLSPTGAWDAFVAKYDPNGNLVWAKKFGGPGDTIPRSDVLEIDKDNNVIVCGNFNRTVDFDPGPAVYNLTSTAHIQSFIVKLNSNGDFIWARQSGNSPVVYSGSNIADVKCDAEGAIYVVGDFSGNCDFDPGAGNFMMQSGGLADSYVSKLDANGNFIWAKQIGNTSNNYYHFATTRGLDVDANQQVYIAGSFTGTFDFDPGSNTRIIASSNYDWYVLKLNEKGEFVWVDVFGGNVGDFGADVAVGNDGSVYSIGSIGPTADMDPGLGVYSISTNNQYGASVLVKVNANGGLVSASTFDQIGTSFGSCLMRRMAMDDLQNIYITGSTGGIIDFDPGANVYALNTGNYQAPYVLKLARCFNVTRATLNISTCDSFTLNNETFDSTGTYLRTIPNSTGCDSVVTLHLTVNKKDTTQTKTICEGEVFFAGGANRHTQGIYRDTFRTWQGCDSIVTTNLIVNPKPVPDLGPDRDLCSNTQLSLTPGLFAAYQWQDMRTENHFTIETPGIYWVEVTNDFQCKATDTLIVWTILPAPANFLKERDSICSYERLGIASTNTYTDYQWSTGETGKSVQVQQPGLYWLTVTDTNGCKGTDTIPIYSKQCMLGVYVPTAFTPNGDGTNDVFKPLLFGVVKQYRFAVYNRWGKEVFQSKEPGQGWDGKVAGVLQPNSVFVWTCTYQLEGGELKTERGTVMLIQ